MFNKKLTLIGPLIQLALQVSDFPTTVLLCPSVNQLGGHRFTWSNKFASTGRHQQESVQNASELQPLLTVPVKIIQPIEKNRHCRMKSTPVLKAMPFQNRRPTILLCRSQWPRGLRRRSVAACLLRSWVRIPPEAWMFVCCKCCVLSGRGLCDELITRPEESYRLWCVVVCDLETSRMRRPWPALGRSAT